MLEKDRAKAVFYPKSKSGSGNSSHKILALLTGLFDTPGGIQTFNRSMVKALDELASRKGWKVTVMSFNDKDDAQAVNNYFTPGQIEYRYFQHRKSRFIPSALRETLKSSIVFFGHINFAALAWPLTWLHPACRKISILYGAESWRPLPILQKISLNQMSKVITISRSTREKFLLANPITGIPFDLLFPCLDPLYSSYNPGTSRKELGLPEGKMILTVSRIDASEGPKKIDLILQSLPVLLERIPDLFYVVLGGSYDGSDLERLKQLALQLGIAKKVFFVGEVPDTLRSSYYKACDVFVLPSIKEGFGIVFLEGMYYAKPCVGADAGGVPEVIEHGKTGFLIRPASSEALIESLTALLTNQALCRSMGEAGRRRLEQEFSFSRFRERLETILLE